jgi:hypothetical protein
MRPELMEADTLRPRIFVDRRELRKLFEPEPTRKRGR